MDNEKYSLDSLGMMGFLDMDLKKLLTTHLESVKKLKADPDARAKITEMWSKGEDKKFIAENLHAIKSDYSVSVIESAIESLIVDGTLKVRQDQLNDIQRYLKTSLDWKTIPDITRNTPLGIGTVNVGLEQLAKEGKVVRASNIDLNTGSPMYKSTENLGLGSKILSALTDRAV